MLTFIRSLTQSKIGVYVTLAVVVVIGLAFGLAYPRHLLLVGLLLVGATALLELTQVFEPSRHGRWLDLGVKVVGGVVGLAIGAMLARLKPAAR